MRQPSAPRLYERRARGGSRHPTPSTSSHRRRHWPACVAAGWRGSPQCVSSPWRDSPIPRAGGRACHGRASGRARKMSKQRELLAAKLDRDSLEGDRARSHVDLQRSARDHARAVDQAVAAQQRSHARKQLGVAKRGPGHVIRARLERAQQARCRLAARAHPQHTDPGHARRKLPGAKCPQNVKAHGAASGRR
jgi:hypothetical protein